MDYGKRLEEAYGCEDIPLLLRANPYKLVLVAYSFALLEGFDEPSERHLKLAYEWLDRCAKDMELDKYVEWWRSQRQLTDKEYESIKNVIEAEIDADVKEHGGTERDAYTYKIVEYLAKNEKGQRDEIAAYAGIEPETISRKTRLLKGLGLLRSGRDGYRFTAKGVRFFKKWLPAWASITEVTQVTDSKGQRGAEGQPEGQLEGCLTPKIGDFSDFSD